MITRNTPNLTLYRTPAGWYVMGLPKFPLGPYLTRGQAESKRNTAERRLGKLADKPHHARAGEIRLRDLILLAAAIGLAAYTLWPS